MKVEISEFYEKANPKNINDLGTLQVYVYDIETPFDLRGIIVRRMTKDKFFFQWPGKTTKDEKGEKVYYPFFSLTDFDMQKKLFRMIMKDGTKYLKKYFKQKEKEKKSE